MKVPFLAGRQQFVIEPLYERDAELLPELHAEGFARAWSESEFAGLIEQDTVFGFVVRQVGQRRGVPAGFVLARVAAGEAEILTVAVRRNQRRLGLGRELMEAVLRHLHHLRAEALFLEVDETNRSAIGLYRRLGFREVARRPGYYDTATAEPRKSDALVMRRDLR